jgi:hypothetical protein
LQNQDAIVRESAAEALRAIGAANTPPDATAPK